MSRKYLSTANLVLKVLGDKWSDKLTLEEISKEVAKEVGKETIDDYHDMMITSNDATELKRILDDLRQDKYVNIFDLDDGTKTKYQITWEGRGMHQKILEARLDSLTRRSMYQRDPLQDERDKLAQAKKAEAKRVYGTPQEKRAYYSSHAKYLSREEYKRNKKYINKKEWQKDVGEGSYSRKSYSPSAMLERKEARRENRGCVYGCIFFLAFWLIVILIILL